MTIPVPFNSQMFETSQLCEQSIHALASMLINVERGEDMAQYIYIDI